MRPRRAFPLFALLSLAAIAVAVGAAYRHWAGRANDATAAIVEFLTENAE